MTGQQTAEGRMLFFFLLVVTVDGLGRRIVGSLQNCIKERGSKVHLSDTQIQHLFSYPAAQALLI